MAAFALTNQVSAVRSYALPSCTSQILCSKRGPVGTSVLSAVQMRRATKQTVRATDDGTVDVDGLVKDLQDKWDRVENKTSVAVYAGGAVVALWLSSTIVGAVNVVPLLPKFLELVGLGYTSWFVYRYLLFKSSREELLDDIEELKKKISGATQETTGQKPPSIRS